MEPYWLDFKCYDSGIDLWKTRGLFLVYYYIKTILATGNNLE